MANSSGAAQVAQNPTYNPGTYNPQTYNPFYYTPGTSPPSRKESEPRSQELELLIQLAEVPVIERGIDESESMLRDSKRLMMSESRKAERLPVGPK